MQPFWTLARRLLAQPGRLTLALALAFLSAGGMGAGILSVIPVLELILGDGQESLRSIVVERAPWLGPGLIGVLPSNAEASIGLILGGLAVLTVFGAAATFGQLAISASITVNTIGRIRRDVFRHALHLPLSRLAGRSSDALSRIVNDTELLQSGFLALTSKLVVQISRAIAGLVGALALNWALTLVALVAAPGLYVVTRKIGKRIRRASRGALRAKADVLNTSAESLQGLRAVKAYSAERTVLGRFDDANNCAVRDTVRQQTMRALGSPLTQAMAVLVLLGLTYPASIMILRGALDLNVFLATLGLLGVAGMSVRPISRAVQEIQMSSAAATRLMEILDEPAEPMWNRRADGAREPRLPRHSQSIEFDGVTVVYPGANEPAVRAISLVIPHGARVAFVGPNGSGKTTLLSLVPRLFDPTEGRVCIDRRDLAGVDLRSLRRQIGVVTQESFLFRGTVRDNIAMGRPSSGRPPTDEQIRDAARRARADEFISRLPGGYDEIIGEQGATLSGGQRQRLAIARAILRDPAILILEEATSMIDADSEAHIAEALDEFSSGRTCLIVAHRLSTVVGADLIVVMDRGEISATGTHAELLDSSPLYGTLARTQLVPTPA